MTEQKIDHQSCQFINSNQLSGINALMYYAPKIFKMAGAGEESALLQTVAIGGTNLIFTMLALLIMR